MHCCVQLMISWNYVSIRGERKRPSLSKPIGPLWRKQSRARGTVKAEYESLSTAASEERRGPGGSRAFFFFSHHAAISYRALVWRLRCSAFLHETNAAGTGETVWVKNPGAGTDLITRSGKRRKRQTRLDGRDKNNWTCVGNLSGHRPIYLPVWSPERSRQTTPANHYWCKKLVSGLSFFCLCYKHVFLSIMRCYSTFIPPLAKRTVSYIGLV